MTRKFSTIFGLILSTLSLTSRSEAQDKFDKKLQSELNRDDRNSLNTIIQYRQLKLSNKSDQVLLSDITKLKEIKAYLQQSTAASDYTITVDQEIKNLINSMKINKYLDLQQGAYENRSMSFEIGN